MLQGGKTIQPSPFNWQNEKYRGTANVVLAIFVSIGLFARVPDPILNLLETLLVMSPYLICVAALVARSRRMIAVVALIMNFALAVFGVAGLAVFIFSKTQQPAAVAIGSIVLYIFPGVANVGILWANQSFRPASH